MSHIATGAWLWLACIAIFAVFAGHALARETFSIDYIVTIPNAGATRANVRWELAGIEEIKQLTLRFTRQRFANIETSGASEWNGDELKWTPNAPYGHLSYTVELNHKRGRQERFDSYAAGSWVLTRARHLFPAVRLETYPRPNFTPKSRARLQFVLPRGWLSATAARNVAPHTYLLDQPKRILDRPRGWFALGEIEQQRQEIAGIMVQLARVPGAKMSATGLFRFLESTLPALQKLLLSTPENLLIVSAPDPMWHGGISGESSYYMHGDRPLHTPDHTSPYLHELFHVLQPFRPAADADWIIEGLAEFYSIELQRRAGLLDEASFHKGLGYFERYGAWNVDLRQQHDNAATNNSAPLVLYALDQRIQRATAGKMRLDDVVTRLARSAGVVDTNSFLQMVNSVSGKKFTKYFDRHVVHGEAPSLRGTQ